MFTVAQFGRGPSVEGGRRSRRRRSIAQNWNDSNSKQQKTKLYQKTTKSESKKVFTAKHDTTLYQFCLNEQRFVCHTQHHSPQTTHRPGRDPGLNQDSTRTEPGLQMDINQDQGQTRSKPGSSCSRVVLGEDCTCDQQFGGARFDPVWPGLAPA